MPCATFAPKRASPRYVNRWRCLLRTWFSSLQVSIWEGAHMLALNSALFQQPSVDTLVRRIAFKSADKSSVCPYTVRSSEEHTSELQSLIRNLYLAFCMTNKRNLQLLHTSY